MFHRGSLGTEVGITLEDTLLGDLEDVFVGEGTRETTCALDESKGEQVTGEREVVAGVPGTSGAVRLVVNAEEESQDGLAKMLISEGGMFDGCVHA
jgi:hypothetical protein|mmetsp:Transcript_29490/g.47443  ORF Transcript_29490/g.47443 Transcript_29490/m.47443 type:complete len:96 (-) Transcript_29490:409-696(-)